MSFYPERASTYCSSGSTACPSSAAIHLRAGWSLGGVQDRYFQYEAAGDQFIGHTVAGLSIHKKEFGLLPPHFTDMNVAKNAVATYLPQLSRQLKPIGEMVLASLVYHPEWIQENYHPRNPLMMTPLFTSPQELNFLSKHVTCDLYSTVIVPMGLPPHVTSLAEFGLIKSKLANLLPILKDIPSETAKIVMEELENRAIGAGTVTRDGLKEMLDTSSVPKCGED